MNTNLNPNDKEALKESTDTPNPTNKQKSSSINSQKFSKIYSNVVYIGHLPNSLTQAQFTKFFQNFGQIKTLKLAKNLKTGKSKHYGFIQYAFHFSILLLKKFLKNFKLLGKRLSVRVYKKGEVHPKLFWGNKRIIEGGRSLQNYCRRFNSTKILEELKISGKLIEDEVIRRRLEKRRKRVERKEVKAQDKLISVGINYEIPKKNKNKNKNK